MFLSQSKGLLVTVLTTAAAVSTLTGDPEGAMVIFAIFLLNTVLETVQHQKTGESLDSLKQLSSPEVRVIREGLSCIIPSSMVTPGNIFMLETGDLVAADGRLPEIHGLTVNESPLIGESLNVKKYTRGVKNQGGAVVLADRTNMVPSGSLVTSERAMVMVIAMGTGTEIGKIAFLMNDTKEQKTLLQVSLDRSSGRLAIAIIAICDLVSLLSLYHREPVLGAPTFTVALAAAAIFEVLSSTVTIVRVMGTQKMAKEQTIIKDLKVVESPGCVFVICSDKTGALTQNRMGVERVYINHMEQEVRWLERDKARAGVKMFLYGAMFSNNTSTDSSRDEGDFTEIALLYMTKEMGMVPEQIRMMSPRRGEIPLDSARKLITMTNEVEDTDLIFVEGAVDVLLKKCTRLANPASSFPGGERGAGAGSSGPGGGTPGGPMGTPNPVPSRIPSPSNRQEIMNQNGSWSSKGPWVLALACRPYQSAKKSGGEEGLIFLGLVAMMDPPRPEPRSAVAGTRQAGIRPVMITGGHEVTTMAIVERIDILNPGGMIATGAKPDQMGDEDLNRRPEHISVCTRASPEHKMRIVNVWWERGHIMAVTGDGVNDAPALERVDIGVVTGITGTEVSKNVASMILADDNFMIIIKTATNGRNVYRNTKNAIRSLLSGNMAGVPCVLRISLLALPLPFTSAHLLFINLVTDSLPAITIGVESPEEGLLKELPRNPKEGIFTMSFIRDIPVQGGLTAAVVMWAYTTELHEGGPGRACTMAFSTPILARLLHGFNYRSVHSITRLGPESNLYSAMAFQLGAVLPAMVLSMPGLQVMFTAADLSLSQLSIIVAAAFLPTLVIQIHKILEESIS